VPLRNRPMSSRTCLGHLGGSIDQAPTTDAIAAELTVPERVLPFLPLDAGKTEDRRLDQVTLLMGHGDLDGSVPLFLIAFFAVFDARKAISHGPRKGL
jgi:hypothetical protein